MQLIIRCYFCCSVQSLRLRPLVIFWSHHNSFEAIFIQCVDTIHWVEIFFSLLFSSPLYFFCFFSTFFRLFSTFFSPRLYFIEAFHYCNSAQTKCIHTLKNAKWRARVYKNTEWKDSSQYNIHSVWLCLLELNATKEMKITKKWKKKLKSKEIQFISSGTKYLEADLQNMEKYR